MRSRGKNRLRLGLVHSSQQVLNHTSLVLLAGLLNSHNLLISLLVGLVLFFLVALAVLFLVSVPCTLASLDGKSSYLGLELLELLLLLGLVIGYLALGFVASFLYALCSDCTPISSVGVLSEEGWRLTLAGLLDDLGRFPLSLLKFVSEMRTCIRSRERTSRRVWMPAEF